MKLDPDEVLTLASASVPAPASPEEAALAQADEAVAARAAGQIHGIVIGKVMGWDSAGQVVVDYPGNPAGHILPATAAVALDAKAVGREAALMFVAGNPLQPIVLGLIEQPFVPIPATATKTAEMDGKQLVFSAEEEIVFRCGAASITLTRAGKILLRGTYLLSRSSGVNRIKGGAVQIN